MPSVLIVDNNVLARLGLKNLLSQEYRGLVFGEARSGEEAAALLASRRWDVALIEVLIPGQDGFQLLRQIRLSYPATRVLMLSPYADPQYALRARQLEASGYVGKNSSRTGLLKAFHRVLAGKKHFADPLDGQEVAGAMPVYPVLSTRECDIFVACVAGKRIGEIAAELNLSIKTVSTYKRRVLDKLNLQSTSDVVRYAIDHQISRISIL